jgi:hypothetical protein
MFFRDSRNHADLTGLDLHQSVRREWSRCGHESRSNKVEAPLQRARHFCLTKVRPWPRAHRLCGQCCSPFSSSRGLWEWAKIDKNRYPTCRHGDYQKILTRLLLSLSILHSQLCCHLSTCVSLSSAMYEWIKGIHKFH